MASDVPPSYDALTSEALPSYEDLQKEVERIKAKVQSDPAFKEKVAKEFLNSAGHDENMKQLNDDVDKLVKNIGRVNDAFDSIRSKLYDVDLKKYKGEDGKTVEFSPEWDGYRTQWKDLLRDSQLTAIKTQAQCDDFNLIADIVSDIKSEGERQDALKELRAFIDRPDPKGKYYNPDEAEKHATEHSDAYDKLAYQLDKFRSRFNTFADYQKVKLNDDITALNTEIATLQAEIATDWKLVLGLGVGAAITIFTVLAGGIIAAGMGPLSPVAVGMIVIGALIAAGEAAAFATFIGKLISKQNELKRVEDQKRAKESEIATLEALKSTLTNQESGLEFIIKNVDLLNNIWLIISNEADLIHRRLTNATDSVTLAFLQKDIKDLKKMYDEFGRALAKYARAGF